ncbi:MAG: tetratricopeptide repeat protein [Candidatus Gottesmanbacteria bacterium]|nr:tetratricopeptide repeat protein [Candidatus Gottesmanbacteria bacterium]
MISDHPTADIAIAAALAQDWKEAIRINLAIVKSDKSDLEALCRLAFAYLKTGQILTAKRTYQKVLALDQYNQIASKNLKKMSTLKKKDMANEACTYMSPMIFLEEPGKTKIVECVHVAPSHVLSTLSAGQEVFLKPKQHGIEVRTSSNTYIAALPDDMSFKLNKMMAGGNTYQTIVKGVEKKSVKVMLRELTRGKKFAKQPSFTSTTSYVSFAKSGTRETPDMTPTGEDADSDASPEESET